jgi:hypothetical protein
MARQTEVETKTMAAVCSDGATTAGSRVVPLSSSTFETRLQRALRVYIPCFSLLSSIHCNNTFLCQGLRHTVHMTATLCSYDIPELSARYDIRLHLSSYKCSLFKGVGQSENLCIIEFCT